MLISGAFGVGKHVAAELIGRLFGLLNNQLVARVPRYSRFRQELEVFNWEVMLLVALGKVLTHLSLFKRDIQDFFG